MAEYAGNVHLRAADPGRDLRLGQVVRVAEQDDAPCARVEVAQPGADDHPGVGPVEAGVVIRMDDPFYVARFSDLTLTVPTGKEAFLEAHLRHFPSEEAGLRRLVAPRPRTEEKIT